ncbi:MAG: FTR1 family protein [Chloroflexota bacterium]
MSLAAAVLIFREGLEAALIVAIMLGYLRKIGRLDKQFSVWAGTLSAAGLAIGFTVVLQLIGAQFDYPAKGIYEGFTSLFAVIMLTSMIFWMSRQARYIKGSLEQSMKTRLATGATWGLFLVAFLTVAREGLETALFLSASAFQTSGMETLIGGVVGLAMAVGVAIAIYVAGVHLNMRTFFKVTTVMLVVFAAAMFRYAIHEFEEVGWVPALVDNVWNTGQILPAGSTVGQILQALIGYVSSPSLIEVLGYFGYLAVASVLLWSPWKRQSPVQPQVAVASASSPAMQPDKVHETVAH